MIILAYSLALGAQISERKVFKSLAIRAVKNRLQYATMTF